MGICDLKHWLEILGAVLALGAAGWWFAAAWAGRGSFMNTPFADLERNQRRAFQFNAIAAFCAGCAAVAALVVLYMPLCRAFG
jgi:hypothetical protein